MGLQKCKSSALRLEVARLAPVGQLRYPAVAPYGMGNPGPGDALKRAMIVHDCGAPYTASSSNGVETVVHSLSNSRLVLLGELDSVLESVRKSPRVVFRTLSKSISGSINFQLGSGEELFFLIVSGFVH